MNPGPNDVHHIDGNDKLKKWGFCILGSVDGFSRKLLWLHVSTTNNDPLVIANFFLQLVKRQKISPNLIRQVLKTYSVKIFKFFSPEMKKVCNMDATPNQRIEAFWSRLKKFRLNWWISFFEKMEKKKLFKSYLVTHADVLILVICSYMKYKTGETICICSR